MNLFIWSGPQKVCLMISLRRRARSRRKMVKKKRKKRK